MSTAAFVTDRSSVPSIEDERPVQVWRIEHRPQQSLAEKVGISYGGEWSAERYSKAGLRMRW